jgi:hypothetical protein
MAVWNVSVFEYAVPTAKLFKAKERNKNHIAHTCATPPKAA